MATTSVVSITVPVENRVLAEYIVIDGWPGVAYWASGLETLVDDAGIRVIDREESTVHIATWQEVWDVVALMASGKFIDYSGEVALFGNDYHVRACIDMIHNPDEYDADADTWDLIIQQACLKATIYG